MLRPDVVTAMLVRIAIVRRRANTRLRKAQRFRADPLRGRIDGSAPNLE